MAPGFFVAVVFLELTRSPVGAELARDSGLTVNIDVV